MLNFNEGQKEGMPLVPRVISIESFVAKLVDALNASNALPCRVEDGVAQHRSHVDLIATSRLIARANRHAWSCGEVRCAFERFLFQVALVLS
eukprot:2077091-Amphidinium_carterae.1